jgi:pyrroline-5-carboxylate reductase
MKIGFIGLGNMAKAIIGGLLKDEIVAPSDIIGASKTRETEDRIRNQYGITILGSNAAVAAEADVLVLAIKPIFVSEVIEEIKGSMKKDALVVSIVAGKTIAFLENAFGMPDLHLVRTMPNTPAMVGEGCTGVCVNANVTDEETELALKLMRSFGKAYLVPERLIDVVGAVSGSSPAFVFMFIEAMADGAVAGGMPRAQAYKFAAQAVLGSAKLVLETGMHPGELKDMVCSPGGTTIEGVKTLEERGLRGAVMDAMEATLNKTKKL